MSEDHNNNLNSAMPLRKEKTSAEIRKSNKPLMEKRRRERINNCLDQLKSILMEVTKKESSYYSKLEKADILEMTVKYLKNVKRQQLTAMSGDPDVLSKYIAGFNECSSEVTKYLSSVDGLSTDVKTRVLSHLASCLSPNSAVGHVHQNVQSIQVPSATALSTLPGSSNLCVINPVNQSPPGIQTISAAPVQLVPAKLPNGDTVYILANSHALQSAASPVQQQLSPVSPNQGITILKQSPPSAHMNLTSPSASSTSSSSFPSDTTHSSSSDPSSLHSSSSGCESPLNLDTKPLRAHQLALQGTPTPISTSTPIAPKRTSAMTESQKENQMMAFNTLKNLPQVHNLSRKQYKAAGHLAAEDYLNNNSPVRASGTPPLQMHNAQAKLPMWRPW